MDVTSPNADLYEVAVMQKDAAGNVTQRKIEGKELLDIFESAKMFEDLKQ